MSPITFKSAIAQKQLRKKEIYRESCRNNLRTYWSKKMKMNNINKEEDENQINKNFIDGIIWKIIKFWGQIAYSRTDKRNLDKTYDQKHDQ